MIFQEALARSVETGMWIIPAGNPLRAIRWQPAENPQQHDRWIDFAHIYLYPGRPAPDAFIPTPDQILQDWELATTEYLEQETRRLPVL